MTLPQRIHPPQVNFDSQSNINLRGERLRTVLDKRIRLQTSINKMNKIRKDFELRFYQLMIVTISFTSVVPIAKYMGNFYIEETSKMILCASLLIGIYYTYQRERIIEGISNKEITLLESFQ